MGTDKDTVPYFFSLSLVRERVFSFCVLEGTMDSVAMWPTQDSWAVYGLSWAKDAGDHGDGGVVVGQ